MKNYQILNSNELHIRVAPNFEGLSSQNNKSLHVFSYKVFIKNNSTKNLKLISRKWIIIDAYGTKRIVEGEGVVGLRPVLKPTETFTYDSWCPIDGPIGLMKGHYIFQDVDTDDYFEAEIPAFQLTTPALLN
jgi:ApaG protein